MLKEEYWYPCKYGHAYACCMAKIPLPTLWTLFHWYEYTLHNTTHRDKQTHSKAKSKAKSLAATKRSCQPSGALGCLCTTQALRVSADRSTWGRASLYCIIPSGTQSPTRTTSISGHGHQTHINISHSPLSNILRTPSKG